MTGTIVLLVIWAVSVFLAHRLACRLGWRWWIGVLAGTLTSWAGVAVLYGVVRWRQRRYGIAALGGLGADERARMKEGARAGRAHQRRLTQARTAVVKAGQPQRLASVGHGVVLFDTKIKTPAGEYPLDATVTAAVDTAGGIAVKSRSTFTRMGVGTLVAGPIGLVAGAAAKKSKKIDDRELYLLVQSSTWATTVKLNPDLGAAARSFAQQVNLAAANAAAVSAKRKKVVAAARRELEAIERDAPATAAAHAPSS